MVSVSFLAEMCFVVCLCVVSGTAQEKLDDALLQAVQSGNVERVRALIAKGASVNAKDSLGNTPLHYASQNWSVECMEILLSNGADVNARNAGGQNKDWSARRGEPDLDS
jgi:ankyrin repeat protein